ncbi:MAG: c-type cytochrome [Rhodospirillales bacterium]|nr:c-type cytochrome [Rhodospirillales bacterium]MDE2574094.1 c-type cytochrome [Rhodospirillales bacterium]
MAASPLMARKVGIAVLLLALAAPPALAGQAAGPTAPGAPASAPNAPGAANPGMTIANEGTKQGAPACATCHGARGEGQPASGFPRLAGLNAAYILHQLASFADGSRANPIMQPVATALTGPERSAVAAYFAGLPLPAAAEAKAATPVDPRGAELALHGDWGVGVPACESCHGPGAMGVGTSFPPLAGQNAAYISAQLEAWQAGTRHDDPLGLMGGVASRLTKRDIGAVAGYFAALPTPPPPEAKP